MTFSIGFAAGELALVAADTRTYTLERGADGLPQLGRLVSDDARKIRSVPGGWLVSNLPPAWKARLDDQFERGALDARRALVASIGMAQQMLAEVGPQWPEYAELLRRERMAWAIELDGDEPALYGLGYDGVDLGRLPDAAQLPQELAETDYRVLASETFRAIGTPRDRGAILNAVRAVARLFRDVAARCGPGGTVGETFELCLLSRPEPGAIAVSEHLRANAAAVAQATDAELEALLTPVGTSPALIDWLIFKKVTGVTAANKVTDASIEGARIRRHRHTNITDAGTGAATVETDLMSHTLPTLVNGDSVEVDTKGTCQFINNTKTVRLKLGAFNIAELSYGAGDTGNWMFMATLQKDGTVTHFTVIYGRLGQTIAFNIGAPGEELSGGTLKVTGQTTNASDEVTAQAFVVTITQQ